MFLKKSVFFIFVFSAVTLFSNTASAASALHLHISKNWAGYAASSDSYTGVSATWTVPASTQTSKTISADAAWVGIGGMSESDLIQAGTQAVIRNGRTEYTAWYELLPDTQRAVPLPVKAGDRISASVNEVATGIWRITITNLTTGQTYQTSVPYTSSHSSAEWIVERPLAITGKATGYLPLSNFGNLTFDNATLTTASGQSQTVSTSGAEQLIMSTSNTHLIAAPKNQSGSSFDVSYLTSSEGNRYLRSLRRHYTLKPETTATAPVVQYQQINTSYVIHVVFGGAH